MTRTTPEATAAAPPASTPALVSVRGLTIDYKERTAVRDVDLDVTEGRITAIIGPSGCGKSSVLAALNRLTDLLPHCRVSGTVRFDGLDVLDPKLDVVALRRRVGMIFQRPNPFPISIRRNLELPLKEHGLRDRAERAERIERALRDVGLWDEVKDRLSAPASRLSGGQQQRLCLARALVLEPDVLLLDEPCSALDPIASGTVEDHVLALRERMTLVLVTHDLAQARRVADDVAFFWTADGVGRLVESGSAGEVFGAPKDEVTRAYLAGMRA